MKKLTTADKKRIMKNRGWRVNRPSGFSWSVWDGRGDVASVDVSQTKAVNEAYEKFLAWQEQDRLGRIAQCVMNWQAGYISLGIKL
jgi:hypothetical protein